MSNSDEEILQVISLFRHGKRNTFENLDTDEFLPNDLTEDGIEDIITKGKNFADRFFKCFPTSPFNDDDFKCYISDTPRTIKTIIYRFSDLVPQEDFKAMNQNELKGFTQRNFFNVVYDDKIFNSYIYANDISMKYFKTDPDYKKLCRELENEISQRSEAALKRYKGYLNLESDMMMDMENYKIIVLHDFLFNATPEIEQTFTEEHKIIKEVMEKYSANKRMIDINISNRNVHLCTIYQLIRFYYEEMKRIKENDQDKKKIVLFSGHDLYLAALVKFLGVSKTTYMYDFNDEINFIIFKKNGSDKLYVRFEYNNELMEVPFSTMKDKKECELDTLLNRIQREYLRFNFQQIMDFCEKRTSTEFYPAKLK